MASWETSELADELRFRGARAWVRAHGVIKDRFGGYLRGLGWVARRIRRSRTLQVQGWKLIFEPEVANAYGRLLAGEWNEPETHAFLRRMVAAAAAPVLFIDVGASVGEMVLDLAGQSGVARVVALEPHVPSAAVCRRSAELNGWSHVTVLEVAAGRAEGRAPFVVERAVTMSRLGQPGSGAPTVPVRTLDQVIGSGNGACLLLIDVEGWEPDVLHGARQLLERARPVVVFEYNHVSRARFDLSTIRAELPAGYDIWRLRTDGTLDRQCEQAWNCVALPCPSAFYEAARPLMEES